MIYYQHGLKIVNKILVGSALDKLKDIDNEFVDCCITSPLYWSTVAHIKTDPQIWNSIEGCDPWIGELGLEPTRDMYVKHLVHIFDEVRRVLKNQGSCWVVMSDSFQDKSLRLVPEHFAISMVDHNWLLRSKIIWYKSNKHMSTAIHDRFNLDWEYVFHFTKSKRYYFVQQYETLPEAKTKSKSSVWDIRLTPKARHYVFEAFPNELVRIPILATCPKNGIVLDPFIGSGTTAIMARKLGRKFLGIEVSQNSAKISLSRINSQAVDK